MADQKYKRNTAYKFRIGDILAGKPIVNQVEGKDRFQFLELGDKKIARINLVGNIVDKYEGQGDTNFLSLTLDDGSGQIRLKTFGDDVEKFKEITQGTTVIAIGVLRYWNDELYLSPEILRETDPKYLLLRKLETEKLRNEISQNKPIGKNNNGAVKDKILDLIKDAEEKGGIEMDEMIMNLRDFSPDLINQEVQKLLEEGIAFEPRPGKIRYLG